MDGESQKSDKDFEARTALWRAICLASNDVRYQFKVRSIRDIDNKEIRDSESVPLLATWRLVEALSLLSVIIRSDKAKADIIKLFGKTGPIEIEEEGTIRYLWAQQTLKGVHSELNGRPDVLVTSTQENPNPGNVTRIIEAKCVRRLGTPIVRSEFAKAHDFRVATYFIWSFYTPAPRVINGAKGLGIDIQELGFDTSMRRSLISDPRALISRVAYAQEV